MSVSDTRFSMVILLKRLVISSIWDLTFHKFCASRLFWRRLFTTSVLLIRESAMRASTGLMINSSAPSSNASVWNSIELLEVRTMTGISLNASIVCLRRRTLNPSIPGITRSSKTRSIRWLLFSRIIKHSSPEVASSR